MMWGYRKRWFHSILRGNALVPLQVLVAHAGWSPTAPLFLLVRLQGSATRRNRTNETSPVNVLMSSSRAPTPVCHRSGWRNGRRASLRC